MLITLYIKFYTKNKKHKQVENVNEENQSDEPPKLEEKDIDDETPIIDPDSENNVYQNLPVDSENKDEDGNKTPEVCCK